MKRVICFSTLLATALFGQRALAVIQVQSTIATAEGVRGQAVISDPTSVGRGGTGTVVTAIAIKEFRSTITIRDELVSSRGEPSLLVRKHNLTTAEAYGFGLPMGYTDPPFTDPKGPWQGLCWPYRDQYDYFADETDPLADDVGDLTIGTSTYTISNIVGIERGGPTDPVDDPGSSDPNWLNRGLTGNGGDPDHPATYFAFDIIPQFGDPNRLVEIDVTNATAVVVTRDSIGNYAEVTVGVPDFTTLTPLPEPASAGALIVAASSLLARSRRRE